MIDHSLCSRLCIESIGSQEAQQKFRILDICRVHLQGFLIGAGIRSTIQLFRATVEGAPLLMWVSPPCRSLSDVILSTRSRHHRLLTLPVLKWDNSSGRILGICVSHRPQCPVVRKHNDFVVRARICSTQVLARHNQGSIFIMMLRNFT